MLQIMDQLLLLLYLVSRIDSSDDANTNYCDDSLATGSGLNFETEMIYGQKS